MRKIGAMILMLAAGVGLGFLLSARLATVQGQAKPGQGFAAVPGELGSEDLYGPYNLAKNWPQDISTLARERKVDLRRGRKRVRREPGPHLMLFRGELPKMKSAEGDSACRKSGPSISFPVAGFWRDATVASLPGTGGTDEIR